MDDIIHLMKEWVIKHRVLLPVFSLFLIVAFLYFYFKMLPRLRFYAFLRNNPMPEPERQAILECRLKPKMVVDIDFASYPGEECYKRVIKEYNDPRLCKLTSIEFPCFAEEAKQRREPTLCELVSDELGRVFCYEKIADYLRDPSLCEKIPEKNEYRSIRERCLKTSSSLKKSQESE